MANKRKEKRKKRECVCDACGMEFTVDKLDKTDETMKNGKEVTVLSFTCPKCDSRFVISVMDDESKKLRDELEKSRTAYANSYGGKNHEGEEKERNARLDVEYHKRQLMLYMNRLKKSYLKEIKRSGNR